ncbi:MAG TPA: hypothetical protein VHY33_11180 [Thermoanaerobaculia bacterium]|jgi:hypothetical protein|nr:hypothetical protein [Thermoanaerobaculia bacterium]
MSFAFNASALAFGARFEQPENSIIPSQASVSLAPTGGDGYETVRNFDYKGIITFDEASVYVTGSEHGEVRNTLASVTIKNLNVLNLLHVDLLSSRITSRHVLGEDEGEITFHGTSADNLRIAGKPVKVNFNHDFYARYPTQAKLARAMALPAGESDDPGIRDLIETDAQKFRIAADQSRGKTMAELLADRYCWNPKDCGAGAPNDHGAIHCSLVDSIDGIDVVDDSQFKDPAELRAKFPVRRHGYVVKVAEFGSIKVGELIIKPGERRLNLLRFQFGCPITGDGTAASVTTNGLEMVP